MTKARLPDCPGAECPHAVKVRTKLGHVYTVCKGQCGRVRNSAHPLAPCHDCMPEYDDDGEYNPEWGQYTLCEVDEIAIMQGNRCSDYTAWLHWMQEHEEGRI